MGINLLNTKNSVAKTIILIFIVAISSIILLLMLVLRIEHDKVNKEQYKRYSIVAYVTLKEFNFVVEPNYFISILKKYDMEPILDPNKAKKIILGSSLISRDRFILGESYVLKNNNRYYVQVEGLNYSILLEDISYSDTYFISFIISLITVAVPTILFLLFIVTMRKIAPLGKLKKEIDKFAKGNLNINYTLRGNDEISQVAKAFHNAVQQIKKLLDSRKLFLRNMMHELRTPITKGVLSTEMLPDSKQKNRLVKVFERLNNLTKEFITIEMVASNVDIKSKLRRYRAIDIIEEAMDLAMVDKSKIKISNKFPAYILIDFKLFTLALKNLIDNALKYSTAKKIQININKGNISIINRGDRLKKPLSYYLEPFNKGSNTNLKKESFGLGLYIVHHILSEYKLKLKYKHFNGFNIFFIAGINTTKKEY